MAGINGYQGKFVKVHGMDNTKIYRKWKSIKQRCAGKTEKDYDNYTSRGITVYEPWSKSFVCFWKYCQTLDSYDFDELERVGGKYCFLEIDRIDNNKGYLPGNIRFVSRQTNILNQRHLRKDNKSGLRGISKNKGCNTWRARVNYKGKAYYLGSFKTLEEATEAYNKKASELHKVQASLN